MHLAAELGEVVFEIYPQGDASPTTGLRFGLQVPSVEAAVQVARDEKISIRQALRFSTGKVLSYVFAPLILGRFTRVHPLLLIFSTLVGASLFGLIGMFLAAPITALAKETFLFTMERVQARREAAPLSVPA